MHGGHRRVPPERWGLTVDQFNFFLEHECVQRADKWPDLETTDFVERPGVLGEIPKGTGYVTGFQVCENFVKPYTSNTECSVALSLNPDRPVESDLLVSHAWSESILEVQEAVNDRAKTSLPGFRMLSAGETRRSVNPAALSIWIRLFALYDFNDMPSITLKSPFVCLVVGGTADVCNGVPGLAAWPRSHGKS